MTTIVNAQDGATAALPTGIDNKAPDAPAADAKKQDDQPIQIAGSQQAPGDNTTAPTPEPTQEVKEEEFLKSHNNNSLFVLTSIMPAHGPSTGDTRVLVRGGPFAKWQQEHPEPTCKFGDAKVSATYVPCSVEHHKATEYEMGHKDRTTTCIQCENAPPLGKNDYQVVNFSISLDGTF